MFRKYYSAIIRDGRVSRPNYDETRHDMRRMLAPRTLGSGWDAGIDERHLRRI